MRYQGRLTTWKDDKGYGFVVQNGGSEQIFVHIKAFASRTQRPVGNELVSYEITTDAKGRKRAENVAFVSNRPAAASAPKTGTLTLTLALAFLAFIIAAAFLGKLPVAVAGLYLVGSLIAYFAYALDKSAARLGRWRTKESTLHLLALLGGWPGALLAQRQLRHKNRKAAFQGVFWGTVAINCGGLGWGMTRDGVELLSTVFGAA